MGGLIPNLANSGGTHPCRSIFVILFVANVCLSLTIQAQNRGEWAPNDYFGIPATDKQDVFFDDFDDNQNEWQLRNENLKMNIRNGSFRCQSLVSQTLLKQRMIHLTQSGDYEIEIGIKFLNGGINSETGLTFGRDFNSNEFNFYYKPNGKYRIFQYMRGKTVDLFPWTYTSRIYNKAVNILTVRKISTKWYFFINQYLVGELPAKQLFGPWFGFTIGGNMSIEVDYFRISEIKARDRQGPEISLLHPMPNAENIVKQTDNEQTIRCKINDLSGVEEVTINNFQMQVSAEGFIEASIGPLPKGHTPIVILAKDRYGNVSRKEFSILRQSPSPQMVSTVKTFSSPKANNKSNNLSFNGNGRNYLLLIGVNKYKTWNPLHNAVKDCNDLANLLLDKYNFERENIITLFDEQANRETILETFEMLQDKITPDDNLLIYYAGHGFYDSNAKLGYWVPVNARLMSVADFIRNSTIHDYLKTINSKHTLLIADACYAGSLFASSRGNINENNKSRWAFTSGNIEKVWDGHPGQNSPFARYLLGFLRSNKEPKLRADVLIRNVTTRVSHNTAQTPIGSPLQNVGDEGGVFVFYQKVLTN